MTTKERTPHLQASFQSQKVRRDPGLVDEMGGDGHLWGFGWASSLGSAYVLATGCSLQIKYPSGQGLGVRSLA